MITDNNPFNLNFFFFGKRVLLHPKTSKVCAKARGLVNLAGFVKLIIVYNDKRGRLSHLRGKIDKRGRLSLR